MCIRDSLGRGGKVTSGRVMFEGRNLLELTEKELDQVRGDRLTMIFQDPLTSLNPVFTIGNQMTESIRIHMGLGKEEAKARALMLLKRVGLPGADSVMKRYPHLLSGGMRQRVMIAMALSCNPSLLIADEPTTALDVTIQAQIMDLILELREELGMSVLLITHDMGPVSYTHLHLLHHGIWKRGIRFTGLRDRHGRSGEHEHRASGHGSYFHQRDRGHHRFVRRRTEYFPFQHGRISGFHRTEHSHASPGGMYCLLGF